MYMIKRSRTPGLINQKNRHLRTDSLDIERNDSDILDKNEEASEIAAYLSSIRKRHDKIKEENLKKKSLLEKLKKTYEKSLEISKNSEDTEVTIEEKIEKVQKTLESTRVAYKSEMKDHKSYEYILSRMKKDKIAMEIKANNIQVSLKSRKHVLNAEIQKFQKVREAEYHSRMTLYEIRKEISASRRKKNEYVSCLQKELKDREEVNERREDRQKRQQEIAEAAANDDKDSHEVKLREALLLYKLWFTFLNKKLNCEMKKAIDVERAFSKIKSATGLADVSDIVEKFLTREQNYLILISAVNEAEKKLNVLKAENSNAKAKLNRLQFGDPELKNELRTNSDEVKKKVHKGVKIYANVKEKFKDSLRIYDQLLNWTEKIFLVLKISGEDDNSVKIKKTMLETFEIICSGLEKLVTGIKFGKNEKMIKYTQLKTDEIVEKMSSDAVLSKIVRVRIGSLSSNEDDSDSVKSSQPKGRAVKKR